MRATTYLIYIVFWESLTIGGSIYLVVGLEKHWTFILLGMYLSMSAYSPKKWNELFGVPQ